MVGVSPLAAIIVKPIKDYDAYEERYEINAGYHSYKTLKIAKLTTKMAS